MPFFPLLLLIPIADTCLNLQYHATTTPSPCKCVSIPVDGSNIRDFVPYQHPFLSNLTRSTLEKATIDVSDCFAIFSCPSDDSELIIVDNRSKTSAFGSVQVNAYCDKSAQTWLFDDGVNDAVSLGQAYATCVTSWTLSECPCAPPTLVDNSNLNVVPEEDVRNSLAPHTLTKPNLMMDSDGCVMRVTCPDGQVGLHMFMDFYTNEIPTQHWNMSCDTSWPIYSVEWFQEYSKINQTMKPNFFTCVVYNYPDVPDGCPCSYSPVLEKDLKNFKNSNIEKALAAGTLYEPEVEIDAGGCVTQVSCPDGQTLVRIYRYFISSSFSMIEEPTQSVKVTCDVASRRYAGTYTMQSMPAAGTTVEYRTRNLFYTCVAFGITKSQT